MTKLEEMWSALAAYQPQADANGHGATWAKMCKERTADAAYDANVAAYVNAAFAAFAAAAAAAAAADAAKADAEKWAQTAINCINKAFKEKNT